MNKILTYILIFASSLLLWACVTIQPTSTTENAPSYKYNFASLYNPAASDLHPEIRIYLKSEKEIVIFYKIPFSELKAINTEPMATETKLMIKYVIRNPSDFSVADSGSLVHMIDLKEKKEYVQSYFTAKIPQQGNSKIVISIYGQKPNSGKRLLADISTDKISGLHFLPEIADSEEIMFGNYVSNDKTYRFKTESRGSVNLKFDYYKFTEYVSVPPYYMSTYQAPVKSPDSSFSYIVGDTISFKEKGMYVLRNYDQTSGGLCLINCGQYYPMIKTVADMLEPIKLLAGNKEYNEIKNDVNLKQAIDNFWFSKSENQKFAREQIRVFYNRISLANRFFIEDKEGWKTDRGMIYVMLGPPSIVNINATGEEWFYGENPDIAGILFIFDKFNNPYCGTVTALRRDTNYQSVWAQALQTWKSGRVFSITN
jgi:GWxTD domain-containing protein